MIYRDSEQKLKEWFVSSRRKPLVLRGARQVGKSTLIENYCQNHTIKLITVNCEKHRQLDIVFETLDIPRILLELEALGGNGHIDSDSVLFLDEINSNSIFFIE